jgi:hypothetical protein
MLGHREDRKTSSLAGRRFEQASGILNRDALL